MLARAAGGIRPRKRHGAKAQAQARLDVGRVDAGPLPGGSDHPLEQQLEQPRLVEVEVASRVGFGAAAGGAGLIACQWARAMGVTMIGTVSTSAPAAARERAESGCCIGAQPTNESAPERSCRAQHPATHLVALDRLEERLEVAFAKAVIALALDEFEEHRPPERGLRKDLQQ